MRKLSLSILAASVALLPSPRSRKARGPALAPARARPPDTAGGAAA